MSASFDPYHRWLGIPPKEQPANFYRLLGLALFENDPEVVRDAAERQMAHVRTYQLGQYLDLSQRILNELAVAAACLRDSEKRAAYDAGLRRELDAATPITGMANRSSRMPVVVGLGVLLCSLIVGLVVLGRPGEEGKDAIQAPTQLNGMATATVPSANSIRIASRAVGLGSSVTTTPAGPPKTESERGTKPAFPILNRKISASPLPAPALAVAPFDKKKAKEHQAAWAKHLSVPVEMTNSIGMKCILVPPGEFMMGSSDSEYDHTSNEGPLHRVRITRPFYLGVYEVNQGEYRQVMGSNPSTFSRDGPSAGKVADQNTDRLPVEQVSWENALGFCLRLSQKDGRRYRLPTEAEWEFACRAGTTTPFSFGNTLNGSQANCDGNQPYGTEGKGPFLQRTTTVGSYRPNSLGLYDLHGNVREWCADWYDPNYYRGSPVDDPRGATSGVYRVVRGGTWYLEAKLCRSAFRGCSVPGSQYYDLGFRVAVTL